MKLFLLFLVICYVAIASACKKDYECTDGCCVGKGPLKKCMKYLKYHEGCTIRKKMGIHCLCRPGLECVKHGLFGKHRCEPIRKQSNLQHCKEDYECAGGCCIGVGALKYCQDYLKVNEKCTMRSAAGMRCICERGLKCVKTGMFTKRCKPVANDANAKMCKADHDCRTGCCLGIGKLKFCKDYLKEGEKCTISSKIGCGCSPGLTCMKVGLITKKCINIQKDCGKPAIPGIRVIGGKAAVRGSWPWQVLLSYSGRPMCGGTLIGPEWVVTAAHCVYGREHKASSFAVTVGEYDRTKTEGTEVLIKVAAVYRHEQYNPHKLDNDITLLKLSKPAKFNKYVLPACLPTVDPASGTPCYITGWGKTHHPGHMTTILQQGKLPVVTNKVCNAKNWRSLHIKVTDAMICGGDGGRTTLSGCHGDSGGPYVCNIKGRWELHGAVSHGPATCSSRAGYSVFARVNYFKGWIYNIIGRH